MFVRLDQATIEKIDINEIKVRCTTKFTPGKLYKKLAMAKLEYGPYFRTIKQAWKGDGDTDSSQALHMGLI